MKNKFWKITTIALSLIMCLLVFAACGNSGNGDDGELKITEEFIRTELMNSAGELDGTLTITSGSSEDVLAFNYVVTEINAEKLVDKNFTKNAVQILLSNPENLTYGDFKVCNAFSATMGVVGVFYGNENFDSNDFTDDILSIICDGSSKTYENWTVSAVVDQSSDSITIKATHN